MGHIKILSKQLANLIAAGEVVERPASVVKELVENSVDAGASRIDVEIKNGGSAFIRVCDNGCGMSREDARRAFLRHATSKITAADDLGKISTMGFRGEALAAVSSVAEVELITRARGEEEGTLIAVSSGEISQPEPVGAPEGTAVTVRDLFFNTPARRKYLKKDATEAAVISSFIDKIALALPHIAFSLVQDGRTTLQTDGAGLDSAAYGVLGRAAMKNMLKAEYSNGGIKVAGLVGRPEAARPNRNMQFFSINGRVIRSRIFQTALEEAFKNSIMSGRYPVCVLDIGIDFSGVDVNVHPSKLEVKIGDERAAYDAVYFAVKNALAADGERPAIKMPGRSYSRLEAEPEEKQERLRITGQADYSKDETTKADEWSYKNIAIPPAAEKEELKIASPSREEIDMLIRKAILARAEIRMEQGADLSQPEPLKPAKPVSKDEPEPQEFRIAGELFGTYVIAELEKEVLFIDKHAAQERILYEKLKRESRQRASQRLISPEIISPSKEEAAAILDNAELFESLGFELEDFGGGSIIVRGVPADIDAADAAGLIAEMAGLILEGKRDARPEIYEKLLHTMACKAAIKGGLRSAPEELDALVFELLSLPDIKHCPHGRPVALTLAKGYFERQFQR